MIIPHVSVVTHPHLWGLLHFYRYTCYTVAWASFFNNFLLCEEMFERHPEWKRYFLHLVTIESFLALNLRKNQPSLGVLNIPGKPKGKPCQGD